MNEKLMRVAGFAKEVDAVKAKLCPSCKKPIGEFRDRLSKREFEISGLCQECQDSVFGGPEESE